MCISINTAVQFNMVAFILTMAESTDTMITPLIQASSYLCNKLIRILHRLSIKYIGIKYIPAV